MLDSAQIYDELTEREIEIVALLAEGLMNKEIAHQTGLTLYTVKWYLKEIYSKLYVSNRTEAAKKAQELGILAMPGVASSKSGYLPQMLTPFFGRKSELLQLRNLLEDTKLLTIHGFGGMGKTRLSIELGRRCEDTYADGVYFV